MISQCRACPEAGGALARLGSPDVIETDGELQVDELALPLAAGVTVDSLIFL